MAKQYFSALAYDINYCENYYKLRTYLNNYSGAKIQINLVEQKIIYAEEITLDFQINEFDRNYLLRGSSQISNTLQHIEVINNFEVLYKKKRFWVDDFSK